MQCPVDGTVLQMTERSGIEIDYCPQCRGVWLDRGELDKMIGHNQAPTQPASHSQPHGPQYHHQSPQRHDDDYRRDDYRHDDHHKKHHKKENFLGDLFDF